MNTGQMMLVIGAFAMLSMLALALNRTMFNSLVLGLEMEATLNALSIGQSMLDEIESKQFDEKVTGTTIVYSYSGMTAPNSLGQDGGETVPGIDSAYYVGSTFHDFQSKTKFDDVDDYHLYHRRVYDPRMGYFDVIDSVRYVSEFAPNRDTTSQTYYKRLVVVVRHPNLPRQSDTSSTTLPVIVRDIAIYRQYF
jgi:hypothetical protein